MHTSEYMHFGPGLVVYCKEKLQLAKAEGVNFAELFKFLSLQEFWTFKISTNVSERPCRENEASET